MVKNPCFQVNINLTKKVKNSKRFNQNQGERDRVVQDDRALEGRRDYVRPSRPFHPLHRQSHLPAHLLRHHRNHRKG